MFIQYIWSSIRIFCSFYEKNEIIYQEPHKIDRHYHVSSDFTGSNFALMRSITDEK